MIDKITLIENLERASKTLAKGLTISGGGAKAEKLYGAAYQACVSAGLKPQLKRKYR
jgi:hypothetical protein